MNKEEILEKYIELTKKLGKFPSKQNCIKFLCSYERIVKNYNSLTDLKEKAIKECPDLEKLVVPVKLTPKDIEDFRFNVKRKEVKKANANLTSNTSFLDYIKQFSESTFAGKIQPVKYQGKHKDTKRILNLVLSDLHFGADLNKEETGVSNYGTIEESRRLASVVKEVMDYKIDYRDNTELEVLLLGDLIQNQLHDARDGAPVAEQCCRAIHLLTQAISQFATAFKSVRVRCSSGNHGRIMSRHKNRAVNQKWDSYETIINYAIKNALKDLDNVEVFIEKTPYTIYKVFGHKILATHGDTVLEPGYPGSAINIKQLENKLNKINAALSDKDEIKVAVVGHVHIASQTFLPNGSVMVTNASLIPSDEYGVSLGGLESNTGQMIFESTKEFAYGDSRFIRVSELNDEDSSLDKIIKPWRSL